MDDIRNVVFGSGGVRGVIYCGALMALEQIVSPDPLFPRLECAAGSSIGSLFAAALCMGVNGERLFRALDDECMLPTLAPDVNMSSLHTQLGMDPGHNLRACILRVLEIGLEGYDSVAEAQTLTLREFYARTQVELKVAVTRIGSCHGQDPPRGEILSWRSDPEMSVLDALHMSMCVPLLYQPVVYQGGLYVDGAVTNAFPAQGMSPAVTLGMCFESSCLNTPLTVLNFVDTLCSAVHAAHAIRLPRCIVLEGGEMHTLEFHAHRARLIRCALLGIVQATLWYHRLEKSGNI
jgi:hypothetical protein